MQVVTVHKSKGPEYPLHVPALCCGLPSAGGERRPIALHNWRTVAANCCSADERQLALADRERPGEDLRKFYVALTRARYATWLGLAPLKGSGGERAGYLLGGGEEIGSAELAARFATLADARA